MAESLAGCRLRLAGPRVGRARSCSQAVIHRIGNERPSNSESNPSGRPVDGKATSQAKSMLSAPNNHHAPRNHGGKLALLLGANSLLIQHGEVLVQTPPPPPSMNFSLQKCGVQKCGVDLATIVT
jgi:hypothetical protein